MSKSDTNQASEEIDKALGYMTMVWDESGVFGQPPDYSHIYLTGKQEAKAAIQDLIRNEKLKTKMDLLKTIRRSYPKKQTLCGNAQSKLTLADIDRLIGEVKMEAELSQTLKEHKEK